LVVKLHTQTITKQGKMRKFVISIALSGVVFLIVGAASLLRELTDVRGSQIEGNVPAASEFNKFLHRDLIEYFRSNGLPTSDQVEVNLLRDEPSQSGVGSPKYYAWVRIYSTGKQLEQGAVEVAAIEKRQGFVA
jgi:hypothetical protein